MSTTQRIERAPANRLLIVRLSAMGDVLHALPAVGALRQAFPAAKIGWVIEERWAELLCAPGTARCGERSEQRPVADCVHTVRLKEWRRSLFSRQTARQISHAWNEVRAAGYDVAVDIQGSIRSAVLARWSKAPEIFGPIEPWEKPAAWFYTHKVITREQHVVEQAHSLAEAIVGGPLDEATPELPRDPRSENSVNSKLEQLRLVNFALLNPGAGWGAKQWPAERYGAVARELAKAGLPSVVNYGPGEEGLADIVMRESGGAARPMQSTISELMALLRRAKLFIGGDTGPMHLAAALKVPVVALFGPTDPARNGPYGTARVVLRDSVSVTSHRRSAGPDPGLLRIQVEDVLQAAEKLLGSK
jgi:heptosyltransferase-1